MNRRELFVKIISGGMLTGGALLGAPFALHALSPLFQETSEELWVGLGPIGQFRVQNTQRAIVEVPREDWAQSLREKGVYVWRQSEAEFVVFSRSCTDLGCPVTWDPGSECFLCPCHGGVFAKNGDRMAGPPRRPLYRYQTRVREGNLEINVRSIPPMA